jgi:hypothetical protein
VYDVRPVGEQLLLAKADDLLRRAGPTLKAADEIGGGRSDR